MNLANSPREPKGLVFMAWISFLGTFVVLLLKIWAYMQTSSGAVLSDACESIVDIISSIITIFIMRAVAEPADAEHPYGHGKLEFFSATFEGGLIAFAALAVGVSAVRSLLFGSPVNEALSGLWIMALATAVNVMMSLFLYQRGKKARSEALMAKAKHLLADVVTTITVMIGLALVKITGWLWIDAVAALLVAVHLIREGVIIIRWSAGGLIDEVDTASLHEVSKALNSNRQPGIIDIHQLKLIRSGRFHHIDAHMVVPEFWDISKSHQIVHDFEKKVVAAYHYDGEVAFHLDPCGRNYCSACDLSNCQVRKQDFLKRRDFSVEHITKPPVYSVENQ